MHQSLDTVSISMAEGPSGQDRWRIRPPTGLDQLTSLALPEDARGAINTAPSEATLDGLLQHPRLPGYLGKLYREIIALRKSQHFWLSHDESSAQMRELCQEMCNLVARLSDPHSSAADLARVQAELRAAILGLRSVCRSMANLRPNMLAKTNLMIMQQNSAYPPDLVRSVHMARMADAKLSSEQCKTIVSTHVTMLERLQQADAERRELFQPLTEILQGAVSDGAQAQFAATANFHNLIDRQIQIRDAECNAIVKYTSNFTRTDLLSWEQTARILAFDHPLINAPDFCAMGRLLLDLARKPRPAHSPPPTWQQPNAALDLSPSLGTQKSSGSLGSRRQPDSPMARPVLTQRSMSQSRGRQMPHDAMDTGQLYFPEICQPMSQPPHALMTHHVTHLDPDMSHLVPDGIMRGGTPEDIAPDSIPEFNINRNTTLQDFESLFQATGNQALFQDVMLMPPSTTGAFMQARGFHNQGT